MTSTTSSFICFRIGLTRPPLPIRGRRVKVWICSRAGRSWSGYDAYKCFVIRTTRDSIKYLRTLHGHTDDSREGATVNVNTVAIRVTKHLHRHQNHEGQEKTSPSSALPRIMKWVGTDARRAAARQFCGDSRPDLILAIIPSLSGVLERQYLASLLARSEDSRIAS